MYPVLEISRQKCFFPQPYKRGIQYSTCAYMIPINIGGGKGGGLGAEAPPPLRMISHQNYLSWSGAENRDKDRDTLIEQSL